MLARSAEDVARPVLDGGEVHVWTAPLDLSSRELARLAHALDGEERERALRFRFERDRERWTASRGWLRLLLARYLGTSPAEVRFEWSAAGKPRLSEGSDWLRFNLSHSAGLAAFVVAHGREVGIDLERVSDDPSANCVPPRFLAPPEQAFLVGLTGRARERASLQFWTGKEAFLKASGLGLQGSPAEVVISRDSEGALGLERFPSSAGLGEWSLRSFTAGSGYVGAIAAHGPEANLPRAAWRLDVAEGGPYL